MGRRDTNDNRYNRQVPNHTEIIYVHVDTAMGPKVASFIIEDKADIIAARAKQKSAGRWTADWGVCRYTKRGYTKSGDDRNVVIADVSDKIRRMVIAYHLWEWFEVRSGENQGG
jgi:hypothetical protein